jgi:hypothetical protein
MNPGYLNAPNINSSFLERIRTPNMAETIQGGITGGLGLRDMVRKDKVEGRKRQFEDAFIQASQGKDLTTEEGLREALKTTAQQFPQESMEIFKAHRSSFPQPKAKTYKVEEYTGPDGKPVLVEREEGQPLSSGKRVEGYGPKAKPPAKAPLSKEEHLEIYKAKKQIDADIAAGKPLTPYQEMMMEVYKDRIEAGEENRAFQKDKFAQNKENQNTERETKFVKNTNELKTEIDMFDKLDKSVPGGIYGKDGISGFGFGTAPLRKFWKTDEANTIRPTLQFLINAILKRQSGAAVSDQEFERLNTAFGINTTGTIEEFRLGLQNYYESARGQYDRYVKADKRSATSIDAPARQLNPSAPKGKKTADDYLKDAGL